MLEDISQFFLDWWEAIKTFFKSAILTIFDLFKELFFWIVDSIFALIIHILNGLGSFINFNPAQYISALPPEAVNFIGLIGLGQAVTIVSAALVIRFFLQLIPFVRLGS